MRATAIEVFERHYIPEPNSGCWLWISAATPKGYGYFTHDNRTVRAHRFAWQHKYGPITGGLFVCHKCDVPSCVNPDHLFLGTNDDNVQDKIKKGRIPQYRGQVNGIRNGMAKLCPEAVFLIRQSHQPSRILADQFGVSEATISRARKRLLWKDV